MSAVMISQALLSPVSAVYASAVDGAASQQVEAAAENDNGGGCSSADSSSNGRDAGSADTTVTDDTSSSDVSPSTSDVAAQSQVASRAVDGYNPNADPIVIDGTTAAGSVTVVAGFFKDAAHTQVLGTDALGVNETVYGMVNIKFDGSMKPSKANPNIKYVFPDAIHVVDNSGTNVVDGKTMYNWHISGNEFIVEFTEAFFEAHNSEIYTEANFEFKLDSDKIGDDGKLNVVFPGTGTTVTFTQKEGDVGGNKTCQLSADGKSVSYTIDLNCATNVTNFKLVDELGANLNFNNDFKLDGQDIAATIDGKTATINLDKLSKGNHKITYTTTVDQKALDALKPGTNGDASLGSVGNSAKWSWTGNSSGNSSQTTPSIKYDLLGSKSASGKDGAYEWTVNINTGSLKADMAGYTFTDTLKDSDALQYVGDYKVIDVTNGDSVVGQGSLNSSSNSFSYTFGQDAKDHQYKIVYSTKVKDGAAFGTYKNDATITDGKGNADSTSGSIDYKPSGAVDVEKVLVGNVDADGYAKWQTTIKLSKLASSCDITKATFYDVPGFGWNEGANTKDNIWFVNDADLKLTANGKELVAGTDYNVTWTNTQNWGSGSAAPEAKNWGLKITFTDNAQNLVGKTDVVVTYRTQCNGAVGTYKNRATFNDGYGNEKSDEKHYEIEDKQSTSKEGSLVWDQNFDWSTIDASDTTKGAWVATWTVKANYAPSDKTDWGKYGLNDTGGNPIAIEDDLAGMTYVPGSGSYVVQANWGNSGVNGEKCFSGAQTLSPTVADGKLTANIPTADVFDGKGKGTHYVWAEVKYQTAVKATTDQKELHFTNTVSSGAGSDSYGSATATVTGKQSIVDKSASYDSKNNLVTYSINVNDQAQDLISKSDVVTLSDTLTGKADLVVDSISVVDAQTGNKLASDEYAYSVKQGTSKDGKPTTTLTFTLPDSRALKVSYKVVISGEVNETGELSNQAVLSGKEGWNSSNKISYSVVKSSVDAGGISTSISIQKADGSAPTTPLSGATFKLYKVEDLNALASGSAEDIQAAGQLVSTKTSDAKGKIVFGGEGDQKLETSVLYYFKETAAPTGFIKNSDITCVVLRGNDADAFDRVIAKLKEKGVNYETKASYVRYNTPTSNAQAEFNAKKVMTGDRTSLTDGEFSFVAKDDNDNEVAHGVNDADGNVTIKGDGLSWDQPGEYVYTVSEEKGSAEGVTYSTVSYKAVVTVERQGAYGPLKATVAYQTEDGAPLDADALPTFTNTYKTSNSSTKVKLAVKKTVNGGSSIAADCDFSFSLYRAGEDGKATGDALATTSVKPGETARFSGLSFDKAGTYQYVIVEDGELGGGWTKAEPVIATVTVEAADDGTLSVKSVTYSNGKDAALFDNAYEANGSATVSVVKTVNGAAPADDQEFAFEFKPVDGAPMPGNAKSLTATTKGAAAASFAKLAYSLKDAGKTYTYRIRETTPATVGWTMADPVTVAVTVGADQGDGTLGPCTVAYSKANEGATAALFDNKYEQAAGEFQLGLVKTVNGESPLKGESFEFSATAEGDNATDAPELASVTTDKDGNATFAAAKLSDKDAGKTYTYRIHEVTDPTGGTGTWTKAADVIAMVKVSKRSDDNKLSASVTYHADGSAQTYEGAAAFDNAFKSSAAVASIAAGKKSVNGATDVKVGEDYTFGLYAKGEDGQRVGKALATVTTKLGESKAFETQALSYDKAGTYEYLVHEENHNGEDGWSAVADVPVTVTVAPKGGSGSDARNLVATVVYGGKANADAALFADTYTATGSATLSVSKTVMGKADAVKDEAFTFELRDAKDKVLSTVTAKAGETAGFAPIAYDFADAGKTFEYTIHEVGHGSGAWFKPGDVKVTVAVSDKGNGELAAQVTYDRADSDGSAALFENAYQPASAALKVTKTINGATEDSAAEEFAFELSARDGAPLPTSTALTVKGTSTAAFDKIRYTEPGTYHYTIHEASDLGTGWTNAGDVEATVTVERDEGARSLKVTKVEYSNANADATAALFDNRYDAKDVAVTLGATKTLSGATLKANQFEFVLRDADGNEVARAKNAADGAIAFPELSYALDQIGGRGKSKTFEYTIEEVAGSEAGVTYDKAVHKVKIAVRDDGASGKLAAEVTYDGAANAPVFENTYTPHTPEDPSDPEDPKEPGDHNGEKTSGGSSVLPGTGDHAPMLASFVATMGLIALAAGLRMSRRKRD